MDADINRYLQIHECLRRGGHGTDSNEPASGRAPSRGKFPRPCGSLASSSADSESIRMVVPLLKADRCSSSQSVTVIRVLLSDSSAEAAENRKRRSTSATRSSGTGQLNPDISDGSTPLGSIRASLVDENNKPLTLSSTNRPLTVLMRCSTRSGHDRATIKCRAVVGRCRSITRHSRTTFYRMVGILASD
jgi:hypothetical protein